jgi:uncharacterized RDD family membrane protein YckC
MSSDQGMTSGDPLQPGGGDPLSPPSADEPRHESGIPGVSSGYSSAPPPGAVGGSWASSPAVPSSGQYALAGWWSRVGAQLIDGLILLVGWIVIMALFGAVFSVGFFASEETGTAALVLGLFLSVIAITIVSLLYAPLMMARTNGKTLGRMATGIRVVRASGEPMTLGYAMLREVAVKALLFGILSSITAGLASLIDVLWPLWDDENRALHDFIVDSRVVQD